MVLWLSLRFLFGCHSLISNTITGATFISLTELKIKDHIHVHNISSYSFHNFVLHDKHFQNTACYPQFLVKYFFLSQDSDIGDIYILRLFHVLTTLLVTTSWRHRCFVTRRYMDYMQHDVTSRRYMLCNVFSYPLRKYLVTLSIVILQLLIPL